MKTKDLLNENNFKFQKKYGQNFLTNPKIPERIAMSVREENRGELCILEIGAGAGALTVNLAKLYKKVCALEIDTTLEEPLKEVLAGYTNAEVVFQDIMKTDIAALCKEKFGSSPVAVCANLPYYITTPIIMALFESGVNFESITVMMQKEVALRICSKKGDSDYGAFTAVVNLYADSNRLFDVGKGNFYPVPKIDSSVLRLTPWSDKFDGIDKESVKEIIRAAFSQRRKTIYNSLKSGLNVGSEFAQKLLYDSEIPAGTRAEQLGIEDFIKISQMYTKMKQ